MLSEDSKDPFVVVTLGLEFSIYKEAYVLFQ